MFVRLNGIVSLLADLRSLAEIKGQVVFSASPNPSVSDACCILGFHPLATVALLCLLELLWVNGDVEAEG